MLKYFIAAAMALLAAPAAASPSTDIKALIDRHWAWWVLNNPVAAAALGERGVDGKLDDISLANADVLAAQAEGFANRATAIPDAGLTADERTDKAILIRLLREQVAGNKFGQRMMLFTTFAGFHQNFVSMADTSPFNTRADYESYLARLAQYPRYNAQAIEITRAAVRGGFVQPCAAMGDFEKSITGVIVADTATSRFYVPFAGAKPADMSDADWGAMLARAKALISDVVQPEYRKFADYYVKDYKPNCRSTVGVSSLPGGPAYYTLQIRVHTTTDMTAEQVHQLGLAEVARIGAEMDALAVKAGFADRAAYGTFLRTDPKFFAKSPAEMMAAAALQAKTIDGMLPKYFGKLPRLPYGVREIPAEIAEGTTTAYYMPGSPPSGIAGNYYVNTSKLDQRPLWELAALTAHEAVPGHHNQIALQQELDLPKFRKYLTGFTAYVEGWALYSEHLGVEMGLYDTREKNMGRLSYEMWRACRLVVDTGLHAKGWTKPQAVAFMRKNTALTDANIDAEVNRYITWPGQALGYKVGELKFRALRAKAEGALGTKFDLRGFHDTVLAQGAVPLDVLEAAVDRWIAGQK